MIQFFRAVYRLIDNPHSFLTNVFDDDTFSIVNFSVVFSMLISLLELTTLMTITDIGSYVNAFSFFMIFVIYSIICIIIIFIESSILNVFVDSREVDKFGIRHIFTINTVSQMPIISIPFITLFLSIFIRGAGFFVIIFFIWINLVIISFWLRYKFFNYFKHLIRYSVIYTIGIPVLLWILLILTMILSGFITTKIISDILKDLMNQLKMLFI
jgi:hypothetical protein